MSESSSSIMQMSFVESANSSAPARFLSTLAFFLQGCAQVPRFPLRSPAIEEYKQLPEKPMQSAPWQKNSSSTSLFSCMRRISSSGTSLASTARSIPSFSQKRSPPRECTPICVEAWTASSGSSRRMSAASPRSCTITASA